MFQNIGDKIAGVYVEFYGLERYLTKNLEYYAKDPACSYRWQPSSNATTVARAISVTGQKYYYVARVFAQGSLHVGKVLVRNKMFFGFNGIGYNVVSYEVLVCDRKFQIQKLVTI